VEKKKIFQGKNYSISRYNLVVNNKKIKQEIIEQKNAVAILAFENDMIIMVKQYRFPCNFVLEIPAGIVNDGETALQCAKREFEEETGYKIGKIKHLLKIYPALGYNLQQVDCFVTNDIKHTGKIKLDETEFLSVEKVSFTKLLTMIKNGKIIEPRTICSVLTYAAQKGKF